MPLSTDMFASILSVVYYAVIVCMLQMCIGLCQFVEAQFLFTVISMAVERLMAETL